MRDLLIVCLGGFKVLGSVMAASIWPEKQSLFLLVACICVISMIFFIVATGPQAKKVAMVIKFRGK